MGQEIQKNTVYILKILVWALVLGWTIGITLFLSEISLDPRLQALMLVCVSLVLLGFIFIGVRIYRSMDELEQSFYAKACMNTIGLTFPLLFIAGILEAENIIPHINALWISLFLLLTLATNVMLVDRKYR